MVRTQDEDVVKSKIQCDNINPCRRRVRVLHVSEDISERGGDKTGHIKFVMESPYKHSYQWERYPHRQSSHCPLGIRFEPGFWTVAHLD